MKELNKLRLMSGLPIDPSIEITEKVEQITEARETPKRRSDLRAKDSKSLKAKKRGVENAVKHLQAAVAVLEKIPATDFSGDVPRYIAELEDILGVGSADGMEDYLERLSADLRKIEGKEKVEKRSEEEEEAYAELEAELEQENFNSEVASDQERAKMSEDEDIGGFINTLSDIQRDQLMVAIAALKLVDTEAMIRENAYKTVSELMGDKLEEAMHYYNVNYGDFENKRKPINVADGSTNDEQVWDEEEEKLKNESPAQLRTMDQQDNSPQDKSGDDLNTKVTVPNGIKQALKTEIQKARSESKKLDVRDKEASYFYNDLAQAFEDLLGHLEKGTRYDIKQAQVFAQTLMGPMLHKIPTNVWKFLTNGGETRSLKSYMNEVGKKYPITGPRNTLK
jgi:hypothetical protein